MPDLKQNHKGNGDNVGRDKIIINKVFLLDYFRRLTKHCYIKAKNRISKTKDIATLSHEFFSKKVKPGTVVTLEGFLSRFSLNHKPNTFTLSGNSLFSIKTLCSDCGHEQPKRKFSEVGQIPVQSLPPISTEYYPKHLICYLYPTNFSSFLLPKSTEKTKYDDDLLQVNSKIKPIPILISNSSAFQYLEKKVRLTGIVELLESNLLFKLNTQFDNTIRNIYSNFYKPYSTTAEGFCIDCRDVQNFDIIDVGSLESLPAAIYIESHIDGISSDSFSHLISKINLKTNFNNGLDIAFNGTRKLANGKEFRLSQSANGNILFKATKPNIIGFYTETDLINEDIYSQDLKDLKANYSDFRSKLNVVYSGKQKISLKPDFLFDYSKAKLFYHKGALWSNDIRNRISESEELTHLKKTMSWLNSE